MKPLFYVHSLFCPNECDLKIKKHGWIPMAKSSYLWKLLKPGDPIPEDAIWYDNWSETYAPDAIAVDRTVKFHDIEGHKMSITNAVRSMHASGPLKGCYLLVFRRK